MSDKNRPEERRPVTPGDERERPGEAKRRLLNLAESKEHSTGRQRQEVQERIEEIAEDENTKRDGSAPRKGRGLE